LQNITQSEHNLGLRVSINCRITLSSNLPTLGGVMV
jgi:hypothetical protein